MVTRDPFSVNYENITEVIRFAKELARANPKFTQLVIKHPSRTNFNITMQTPTDGAIVVWRSDGPVTQPR